MKKRIARLLIKLQRMRNTLELVRRKERQQAIISISSESPRLIDQRLLMEMADYSSHHKSIPKFL